MDVVKESPVPRWQFGLPKPGGRWLPWSLMGNGEMMRREVKGSKRRAPSLVNKYPDERLPVTASSHTTPLWAQWKLPCDDQMERGS